MPSSISGSRCLIAASTSVNVAPPFVLTPRGNALSWTTRLLGISKVSKDAASANGSCGSLDPIAETCDDDLCKVGRDRRSSV